MRARRSGRGRGSAYHRLVQRLVAHRLSSDEDYTLIEGNLNGKNVDVLVLSPSGKESLAVEVHLNRRWDLAGEQVLKDLAAGADHVLVVLPTAYLRQGRRVLREVLPKAALRRTRFCSVEGLFRKREAEPLICRNNRQEQEGNDSKPPGGTNQEASDERA